MTHFTAIKHSTNNGITLYKENGNKIYLRRKALDILLKNYILYIDETSRTLTQGQQYYKIAEKWSTEKP